VGACARITGFELRLKLAPAGSKPGPVPGATKGSDGGGYHWRLQRVFHARNTPGTPDENVQGHSDFGLDRLADRVDDILASRAAMPAAAGPFCITLRRDRLAERGSKIDIVERVDRATG